EAVDDRDLDARIEGRVGQMWRQGLVAEVRALAARGLRQGRTARAALGYQQVLAYLAGELSEEQAYAETVRATRRFARRQRSWFRRDPRPVWLDATRPDLVDAALAVITAAGGADAAPDAAGPAGAPGGPAGVGRGSIGAVRAAAGRRPR